MLMVSGQGGQRGASLASSLGLRLNKREGHDLAGACIACQSSDAFRLRMQDGVAHCFSCHAKWSPFQLAAAVLGDRAQAKNLMVELGIFQPGPETNGQAMNLDPIEAIARQKGVTAESLRAFGAKTVNPTTIRLPGFGPDGNACTHFSISTNVGTKANKGLFAKNKSAGLFFPHIDGKVRLPRAGEVWHLVEGPKDAAALYELGLLACGLNTCRLAAKFARLFAGVEIILVPDRDRAGEEGAQFSARVLRGIARSVRIAVLPAEFKETKGDDVRDVLRQSGGRELVMQAIADARVPDYSDADEADEQPDRPACASIDVALPDGASMKLEVSPKVGSKPQRVVCVKVGNSCHVDRIDVASANSRKRFIREIARKANADVEAVAAAIEVKLIELTKQADADAQRIEQEASQATFDGADDDRYCVSDSGCICRLKKTEEGEIAIPLCNFSAKIVDEVTCDDGVEQRTTLTLEGRLSGGVPLTEVSIGAEEFSAMNWPIRAWGSGAVVRAGSGNKDQLREAIQLLSKNVKRRTVYGQTGWRLIGGQWHYLHAMGAIVSARLSADVATDLPDALARFVLPQPPAGDELRRALLASLRLLDLAPDRISAPILAAVYRAPLGGVDHSLFMCGASGMFKSETAALAQQHFGTGFDKSHLPANWASTANAIEGLAFAAADALLVIDDFAPQGGANDQSRSHRDADRVLRAQGNQAGRQRMRADGSLRPSKPPRGLILSTGEDVPRGQSLRARMLILELSRGDVATERLSACQRDARDGLYAAAMAAFLQWLAPSYSELRNRLAGEVIELRDTLTVGACHARTPGIVADLAIGLRYLLRFAIEAGAIDQSQADELLQRGCAGILASASSQAVHQQSAEPAQHFGRLLTAVIASGRGHLAGIDGGAPEHASLWGWREITFGAGVNARSEWQPQGKRIGWSEGDDIYLEPEAAFAEAQRLAGDQGDALAVSPQTLWRRLKERGLLAAVDEKRETLKVRKTVEGTVRGVLHVAHRLLFPENPTNPTTLPTTADAVAGFACRVAGRVWLSESENPTPNPTTPRGKPPSTSGKLVGLVGFPAQERDCNRERGEL